MVRFTLQLALLLAFSVLTLATSPAQLLVRSEGSVVEQSTPLGPLQGVVRPVSGQAVIRAAPLYGGPFYGGDTTSTFSELENVTLTDEAGRFSFGRSRYSGWLIAHSAGVGVAVARPGIEALVESEGRSFPIMAECEYAVERATIEVWHRGLAPPVECTRFGRCRSSAPADAFGILVAVNEAPPARLPVVYGAPVTTEAQLPTGFRGEVFAIWQAAGLPLTVTKPILATSTPAGALD